MKNSQIEWTDHTFNPWMGCTKISPGCLNCYAARQTNVWQHGRVVWGPSGTRVRTKPDYWKNPRKWNREAQRAETRLRVFCASLADVFEDGWDETLDPIRRDLFVLIKETPHLDWLLLTKRPEQIAPTLERLGLPNDYFLSLGNVWLGTTVEDQPRATLRVPILTEVPAVVHFLSCEPLLGSIPDLPLDDIEWVIAGGESGPGARPMEADWAREVRDQCLAAGVGFHFKQWGGVRKNETGRTLDGQTWDQFPTTQAPLVGKMTMEDLW